MSRFSAVCLLATASLAGAAAGGRADELSAQYSPPVDVPAPPAGAILPGDAPPLGVPMFVPAPAPCGPLTLCDFAATFKPVPGTHEAWLINPVKGCPVKVCFTLPCGCPKVRVCKREIVFDYGCQAVKISFGFLCGKVRVAYR